MSSSQAQMEKMQCRQGYRNEWHSDLMSSMTDDAPYCCFAMCCPYCASYLLRKRLLYDDMSRYVCCGGYMPCSGRCGEKNCPELCLCTEVFCCFSNSVASTRFLLQDQFDIQTTKCDNCIIVLFLRPLLARINFVTSQSLLHIQRNQGNSTRSFINSINVTQHKLEMDKRDGRFGPQPMGVPPPQQMSRVDQPYPQG